MGTVPLRPVEGRPASPNPPASGQAGTVLLERRRKRVQRRPQRPTPALVHVVRLLILGVGIGAIAGTVLSIWDPAMRYPATANQPASKTASQVNAANAASLAPGQPGLNGLRTGRELTALSAKIAPLTQGLTDLVPGVFLVDLDNGDYYSLNGGNSFSAASMIKVPVLIAFLQDIDSGRIKLDEMMTLQQSDVGEGSGDMQYNPIGSQYTALEVATNMIVISDNTATNMLIRRMGGKDALNQRFQQWGLQQTAIRNPLPDLEGTNTTSPKELVTLLSMVSQGQILSMKSRDRAFAIMRQTVTDTLLPTSLGQGATIAHKTGDIGSLVGDTGVIDMPSGKRYVITALVKRPNNDSRAQELIRQIARQVYDYFDESGKPTPAPASAESSPAAMPEAQSETGASAASPAAGTAPSTAPSAVPSAAPTVPPPDATAPSPVSSAPAASPTASPMPTP